MGLPLAPEDEPNRYCIQLYHRTATQADLGGKQVLEVSSGHGGGAAYLVRTLRPAAYTGLDYNPDGVAFAQKRHHLPGLEFVHGNAENLPFPDESFDAVINVEASHAYPHFDRFLPEMVRVLRPGGHFLYADFRGYLEYDRLGCSTGRHANADGFEAGDQHRGSAWDGCKLAALPGPGQSRCAHVPAAFRPRIHRRAGHPGVPRIATREAFVPDVLLHQRLRREGRPVTRWDETAAA